LAFDIGLAILVLGVAIWTTAARDTFASVIGFVTYGLLLALVWVRLAAPDVALTEAAIGSGVTGGLLLGASIRLRGTETPAAREEPGATLRLATALLCTLVSAGLATTVLLLPEPARTLAPQAAANLAMTGLGNPVTAVLMAYRAIDTLLETVVLLLALVGIWSLAPDRLWGGLPGPRHDADPNSVLTFVAQLLVPVGILIGIHIFWVGSVAPGGEFQGATILAAMWILAMMAGLVDAPPVGRRWLRLLLVAGPAVFFAIGLSGFAMAGAFLAYPASYAKLLILTIEIPVTLSIAATLALLVAGPPERAPQR
jgi:multisubunit Na+/H+ antiporter MnhB subunit